MVQSVFMSIDIIANFNLVTLIKDKMIVMNDDDGSRDSDSAYTDSTPPWQPTISPLSWSHGWTPDT